MIYRVFSAFFLVLLMVLNGVQLRGQVFKQPQLQLEINTHLAGGKQLPFWMLNNQYGKYNLEKAGVLAGLKVGSQEDTSRVWDLQWGLEGITRLGETSEFRFHQAYARLDYRRFIRLQAGMKEETIGNQYTPLSSGSIIWSENARPMPKIEIGSAGYIDVPFTNGLFQVQGSLAHGWFENDRYVENVWMHQKYAGARTRFNFPLNFNFTFHHFAMWGGNHPRFGQLPNDLAAYRTVFFVGKGGDDAPETEQLNRYGNHIGSRNYGIDWQGAQYELNVYFQDIYEDGSGARLRNFPDGLWGVVWKNSNEGATLVAVLYEYLQTTDQSGPVHTRVGLPGDDNYFNHHIYLSGWTNERMTIGTPFITSPLYTQHIDHSGNIRIWNNRVKAHQIGLEGLILKKLSYLFMLNFSSNKGVFSSNSTIPPEFDLHKDLGQWTWMLNLDYTPSFRHLTVFMLLATDRGDMYGDNYGLRMGIRLTPNH